MPEWIDTHCHLDAPEFDADRALVVQRARDAQVSQMVIPAVLPENFESVRVLAHRYGFHYALGVHPLYVERAGDDALAGLHQQLSAHQADPRLVAVGEIGLDLFLPGLNFDLQQHFYREQLKLARAFKLPVILHVRRSADQLLAGLRRIKVVGGIAHAFNGSLQQAVAFVELGFKLGFGGAMTFERALQIRKLAQELPASAIVLETDAPDIPPHWLYKTAQERAAGASARNEPCELPQIAQTLAMLRGWTLEQTASQTSGNARDALPRLG